MTYYAIKNEKIKLTQKQLFKIFSVSKSGYHSWVKRYENQTEDKKITEEKEIVEKMKKIIRKLGFVPGKRMFNDYLFRDYNLNYGVKRIKRIMDKYNFKANTPKKDAYKGQATHNHECAVFQNYVDQNFKQAPRQVILTDITYLYYGKGRELCYLCCFKDAYTNEILGYSIGKGMTVELVKTAYNMMMDKHGQELKKEPKVYIHSDQGSQYLSTTFIKLVSDDSFIQSTSARGNSQDNAPMESFFGRMKTAILDLLSLCPDYDTTIRLINGYLESYNNQYQHSLACLSPIEFYKYATTGIYPLDSYYGVKATELHTVEEVVKAYLEKEKKKQDEKKAKNRDKRIAKANLEDPLAIINRDIDVLNHKINKCEDKIKYQQELKVKYNEILEEAKVAREFIVSVDDEVIEQLRTKTNWINFEQLHYVYEMRGFF